MHILSPSPRARKSHDIAARYTRRPTRCLHCEREIPVGQLVHVASDDDGRPRAACVGCDLDRRLPEWRRG